MKLSVVVPVYNVEQYIVTSLKSLESQTIFQDLKIILVDDSSTDQSYQICQQFFEKHPANVVLLKNTENKGVSYTRNRGLDEVDTDYVTFFDPDDVLSDNMYEKQLSSIIETDADIVVANIFYCDNFNKINDILLNNQLVVYKEFDRYQALVSFYKSEDYIGDSTCNKIFKFDTIKDIRFQEQFKLGEDILFVQTALKKSSKIITNFNNWGYFYLKRDTSAVNTVFNTDYMKSLKVLEEIKRTEDSQELIELLTVREFYYKAIIINRLFKNNADCSHLLAIFRKEFVKINKLLLFKYLNFKQMLVTSATLLSPSFYDLLVKIKNRS